MGDNQFARLFEIDGFQLLLTIEEDEENDEREIVASRTEIDGLTISIKLGSETFDARDYLLSFTEEQAVIALESAKSLAGRFSSNG